MRLGVVGTIDDGFMDFDGFPDWGVRLVPGRVIASHRGLDLAANLQTISMFGKRMNPAFENRVWALDATAPWQITDCEHCIEIAQLEGAGAMHISSARKKAGAVLPSETLEQLKEDCPTDTEVQRVSCGEFTGYAAEYVDWSANAFWRKWFVACGQDLLFITYTCKHGEEDLEVDEASKLLASLYSRA